MVFGPLIGAALGACVGASLGSLIFSGDKPRSLKHIIEAADKDPNIRPPAISSITDEIRKQIRFTPEWTWWPDYDRWVMINRLVRLMWPKLTAAILSEVIAQGKPIVQDQLGKLPFIEDITLGPNSLLDAKHLDTYMVDKYFHLGDHPVRVAGMKVYKTTDDSCILETPVMWGSNMKVDLQVYVKVGPLRLVIPVQVSDVQFKVLARIILAPLVEQVPVVGGATISLLDIPHVDAKFRAFGGVDMMALPGIRELVRWAVKYVVGELAWYPNCISVPLMPNYGVAEEPKGMIHVRLYKIEGLKSQDFMSKSDAYVQFEVRQGRSQRSKTVRDNNNPEFHEEFFLVADDLQDQKLNIKVFDSDTGFKDEYVGEADVFFSTEDIKTDPITGGQSVVYDPCDWIQASGREKQLVIPLYPARKTGVMAAASKVAGKTLKVTKTFARIAGSAVGAGGPKHMVTTSNIAYIQVAKTAKQLRLEEEVVARQQAAAEAARQRAEEAKRLADLRAKGMAVPSAQEEEDDDDDKEEEAPPPPKVKKTKALLAQEAAAKKEAEERQKAEDERIVLVEQEVVLRGNSTVPAGAKPVGQLYMSITFIPLTRPAYDDDIEMTPVKEGLAAFIPFQPPPPRQIVTNVSDFQKGLLTIKIIQAKGLGGGKNLSSVDPYVQMSLVDCDPARPDETQITRTIWNDASPRWGDSFDFVMVSAGSRLTITMMDATSLFEMVASLKLSKARFQPTMIGKVQIPVSDVVRNGHLRDVWALQEAESGTIEMKLEWQNCYVDEYGG